MKISCLIYFYFFPLGMRFKQTLVLNFNITVFMQCAPLHQHVCIEVQIFVPYDVPIATSRKHKSI